MNKKQKIAKRKQKKKRLRLKEKRAQLLKNKKVVGIITDGDVRRILEKYDDPLNIPVSKLITNSPKKVDSTLLAIDALEIMTKNKITNLIVINKEKYVGMIHIHDIIKIGL